jgi:aminopeptidase N
MDPAEPKSRAFALLENKSVSVPFRNRGDTVKANAGDAGYFRVIYEPEMLEKLRLRLNDLPPADRLNLLNDAWAMVVAGRAPATSYLELAQGLKGERTFAIWSQVISTLGFIDALEQDQPGRAAFRDFACHLLQPELKRLTWKARSGEPGTDALLRSQVISALGLFGDMAVITEAQSRYAKFIAKPSSLAADLRSPVLLIAGRYADRATYDQLHELALKAKGTEERQLYYRAMSSAQDPELATLTLSISLGNETIPQETAYFPSQVATLGGHSDLAWDFAKHHMKELLSQVEFFRRNSYVPGIMGAYCDAARADELERYVTENVSEDALPKAKETAAGIRLKASVKQRELPGIDKWIASYLADRGQ